MTKFKRDSYSQ